MITKEEIYAMMADGYTLDEIAEVFTENLNAAKKEYESKRKEEEKLKWLIDIQKDQHEWLEEYYPELAKLDREAESTARTIIEILDGASSKEVLGCVNAILSGLK